MVTTLSHEVAWAAGLFDGEGSVMLCNDGRGQRRKFKVSMTQKDRRVLDRLVSVVAVGNIYRHPSGFYYQANGRDAETVMALLWPYLSEFKREQGVAAMAGWHPTKYARSFFPDGT
jgi:hypothetical protein